ncbi:MAG: MBL fold metallo-hydrolase [Gammaproteobacteria bacterium]|nr:MBL fold metallo-hydrolase [Gammaproteobacteria bacterium]
MTQGIEVLKPIDRLEIVALMDNVSDPFTKSHPNMRWNESQYRAGVLNKTSFCGSDFCRACNGLSLFMRFHIDGKSHTILFDAGPDEALVVDNAKRMGVDLTEVEAIILSHGHFDHYGGILSVLDAIGRKDIPVYTHPELFIPRAFNKSEVSYNLTNADIEAHGGVIHESKKPVGLFENALLISGEVPRETAYETGSPAECRKQDGIWKKSPDVIDERSLIFNLKNKGLCVFTACGHTGVINATRHAMQLTDNEAIHFVMGGFHLAPSEVKERINPTIDDLVAINPNFIITGHCTGAFTQAELSKTFGEQHIPYGVGTVFDFQ